MNVDRLSQGRKLAIATIMFVGAMVAAFALMGCASMSAGETTYLVGGVGDLATTKYGFDRCHGHEGNPIIAAFGEDQATVLVTSLALKWAVWKILRRPSLDPALFVSGVLQLAVVGSNVAQVNGCPPR